MTERRRGTPLLTLLPLKNGDLLAGGYPGLMLRQGTGQSWEAIPLLTERRIPLVRALIQDERGLILAGTDNDGVFASFDGGKTWRAANDGLTVNRVFSLGVDGHGRLVAGTSAGVFRAARVQPAQ